jgi:hypothetical protein
MKHFDENQFDLILNNLYISNFSGVDHFLTNKIIVVINFYKKKHSNIPKNIFYYHLPYNFESISLDHCLLIIHSLIIIFNNHPNNIFLFNCKSGHHRSACGILLYLIIKYKWNYKTSYTHIKSIRKYAFIRNSKMYNAIENYSIMFNKIFV